MQPDLSNLKIATVDDSAIVAERIRSMLIELDGITILGHAADYTSAVSLIENNRPDVAIIDLHLGGVTPHTSGIDLLKMMRGKYPDMKIVILTNLSQPFIREMCIELGTDFFLDKSYDFSRIPEILHTIRA